MYCSYCCTKMDDLSKFCPVCGKNIEDIKKESEYICSDCGKDIPKGVSYCWHCGGQIEKDINSATSVGVSSQLKSKSLKANKKIVDESVCKICNAKFTIGEDINQCEKCQNYLHSRCWKEKGGCNQPGCKEETKPCPMCGKEIKQNALKCKHCGQFVDEELLKTTQIRDALKKDLRGWGTGLIIMGVISFLLSGFLDPIWGGILIAIGVATLIVQQRGMFIIIGIGLILAGIMNISAGGGWKIFGFLQIYWGIQEIRKFNKYAISVQLNKELIPD